MGCGPAIEQRPGKRKRHALDQSKQPDAGLDDRTHDRVAFLDEPVMVEHGGRHKVNEAYAKQEEQGSGGEELADAGGQLEGKEKLLHRGFLIPVWR